MKLLVLNCYSRNALAVINSLDSSYELHGADAHRAGFLLGSPDRHFKSPRLKTLFRYKDPKTDPEGFEVDIIALCRDQGFDGVIPTGTTTTNALARFKKRIEGETSSHMVVEDGDILLPLADKWPAYQACVRAGVPVPRTRLLEEGEAFLADISSFRFPVVVKPRLSFAARDVFFFRNLKRLSEFLQKTPGARVAANGEPLMIVQEAIEGELHDVVLCAAKGEILGAVSQRREVTLFDFGGGGIITRTTDSPASIEIARRFIANIKWTGPALFDFIRDRDGEFCLLEFNPKFWGTTYMATLAGVNIPQMAVDIFVAGRQPSPSSEYKKNLLYKYWYPECIYHWFTKPRSPARIWRRLSNTMRRYGAVEVRNNLSRENIRHLIGMTLNRWSRP